MISLNVINGAANILYFHQVKLANKFDTGLVGVEMGIAYGGGVESLGALWKGRGEVHGYDTFEELHPDHLVKEKFSFEARCMDHWYNPKIFGTKALSYDFQRKTLDMENLDNVHLHKGLITSNSCKDLDKIHYVLLDMDILESMKAGYDAVIDKLVVGGYLFIHDALPAGHLPRIHNWLYKDVLVNNKDLQIIGEWSDQFLVGLEKI